MSSIICEKRIYDDRFSTHSHLYGQLILPIKGKLYIETDCKKLEIDRKKIFFLPPDCEHMFKAQESNEFLTLDIDKQILNDNDMKKLSGGKEIEFDDKWKAIEYLLLNECARTNNSAAINSLFEYCYQLIAEEAESKSIQYINEHFYENIDLKTLADIEHYNMSYYSDWFKNNMNITVTEYIKNLRIKKAKELMTETDLSILQIAQRVGYEHNSSFTRAFKETEGISPAQFRKESKNMLKLY